MREFYWVLKIYKPWGGDWRLGFSHQKIRGIFDESVYLERWILWAWKGTVRIHKFHRSDDDRALHDHPFWFWTFPFSDYEEKFWSPKLNKVVYHIVTKWRFHFRPALHRHAVILPDSNKPIWTFVITGDKERDWGFWPEQDRFVYWEDWYAENNKTGMIDQQYVRS